MEKFRDEVLQADYNRALRLEMKVLVAEAQGRTQDALRYRFLAAQLRLRADSPN